MSEETSSSSPDEPGMFRFIEVGMRLTYELQSIGQIKTSLGQTVEFYPVISSRGWSTHKELIRSLRFVHLAAPSHVIGHCLVDRDEVAAWGRWLRMMQEERPCCDELPTRSFEYVTRHGVRLIWHDGSYTPFTLHVASRQAAILPTDFVSQLLKIFDDFEGLCRKFE